MIAFLINVMVWLYSVHVQLAVAVQRKYLVNCVVTYSVKIQLLRAKSSPALLHTYYATLVSSFVVSPCSVLEIRVFDLLLYWFSSQVMTTFSLQRRLQNVSITVSAQEPGYVKTELNRGWRDKSALSIFNDIGYASGSFMPPCHIHITWTNTTCFVGCFRLS